MSYLPHTRGDITPTIEMIERSLLHRLEDFDVVLVTGLSGVIPAAIFCYKYNKKLVVLRKDREASHGSVVEGPYQWEGGRYIILDDFIASGRTLTRLVMLGMEATMRAPEFVLLYEYHRNQCAKVGAHYPCIWGLKLQYEGSNIYTVISFPEKPEDRTMNDLLYAPYDKMALARAADANRGMVSDYFIQQLLNEGKQS